jgi:hypothetical protein
MNISQIPEPEGSATNREGLLGAQEQPRVLHARNDVVMMLASCSQDVSPQPHAPGEANPEPDTSPNEGVETCEDLYQPGSDDRVYSFDNIYHMHSDGSIDCWPTYQSI